MGFTHSETLGSKGMCPSPRIIAACHVLHGLPVPRHPPCALIIFSLQDLMILGIHTIVLLIYQQIDAIFAEK